MTVEEYLEQSGRTEEELAELLDLKPHGIKSLRKRQVPKSWRERLGLEPEPEPEGRRFERDPMPPPGARVEAPPAPTAGVDMSSLAGYIEGAYKLGAKAIEPTDAALSQAIDGHAADAGRAWARWVESEPKVAAFLQRMMVGTPLGEVIAVHVGIGFSYFLARQAIDRARRDAEPERDLEAEPADGFAGNGPGPEPRPAFSGA